MSKVLDPPAPEGSPKQSAADRTNEEQVAALHQSFAVISFKPDGHVLEANANFSAVMGWSQTEVVGMHHRRFCSETYGASPEYRGFWEDLRAGMFKAGRFHRLAKDGSVRWLQATYTPIRDGSGRVVKVVKIASNVTEQAVKDVEETAKLEAIDKTLARIEFTPEGKILHANDNFLGAVGYDLDEIVGEHHRMFCTREFAESPEYADFWRGLKRGRSFEGLYKRLGKGGREVWIRASYNPVLDPEGAVQKVVKFAMDVTEQVVKEADATARLDAIDKSQAVIEFDTQGVIRTANANFLGAVGYALEEIQDRHHRMFCTPEFAGSPAYAAMWEQLRAGQYMAGRYLRIGRGGKEIWIQASYNPVFSADGEVAGVVKYATDVTDQVELEHEMKSLVSNVEENAVAFVDKTQGIVDRTTQVANQAERLGATSEEMSANVEELSASIASIASSSTRADELAKGANLQATNGAEAIREAREAMEQIARSSEEVGDIVAVIGEIASQTNLLAFNAAIEAARAGQHGRGFAVVADEVRKLAERSSKATHQITKLIQESNRRVQAGTALSSKAADAFVGIRDSVQATSRAVAEIASAAEEQSLAAEEVNGGVQSVSLETENVAHASEDIARACRDLDDLATALRERVQGA